MQGWLHQHVWRNQGRSFHTFWHVRLHSFAEQFKHFFFNALRETSSTSNRKIRFRAVLRRSIFVLDIGRVLKRTEEKGGIFLLPSICRSSSRSQWKKARNIFTSMSFITHPVFDGRENLSPSWNLLLIFGRCTFPCRNIECLPKFTVINVCSPSSTDCTTALDKVIRLDLGFQL